MFPRVHGVWGRRWLALATIGLAATIGHPGLTQETPSAEPPEVSPVRPPAPATPASSLEGAIDREITAAQRHLIQLGAFSTELERAADAERERVDSARTRAAELAAELQIRPAGSAEMSGIYDRVVVELKSTRLALRQALDDRRAPSSVPVFAPGLDPDTVDVPAMESRLHRLRELRLEIDQHRTATTADEERLRFEAIASWGSVTERLNELRIKAIENLPTGRRRQVLGIGREGFAQFQREVEQLELSTRLYQARQASNVRRLPGRMLDIFVVGSAIWTLVKVLVAAALFVFLRRRGPDLRKAAFRWVSRNATTASGRRRGELLVGILVAVAPWGLFLGLIAALRWAIGPSASEPELDLPLRVATLYGIYRLAIDVVFAIAMRLVRRYKFSLDGGRAAEILRSIRTMMRVVVGILVLLTLSERFVGRGYLYGLVLKFAWVFVLGAALVLLERWRGVIADAYLDLAAQGRLATMVRRSRDRWYGVFVAGAAFVGLAARAVLQIGRDFVMGFDQTRRALAFVFRRKVEKSAEQRGYAEGDPDDLPGEVVKAFAEAPLEGDVPPIEHFPGLDRLHAMIDPWLADEAGASFLLSGEQGMGKSSWLGRIDARDLAHDCIAIADRDLSEAGLTRTLAKGLALEGDGGLDNVRRTLAAGPKRIVAVDMGQNLFLSKVGGYDLFEKFVSLVEATCSQVFWVCSISAFAWDHLVAVRPDLMVFRDRQVLGAWSEEQIGAMLNARTELAGVEVVYDDLVLEARRSPDETQQLEIAQQYMRLLWDYSDGNPRAALHFWLRSLVPHTEQKLRVRLFRAPTSSDLADLPERSRFLLAAIVVHENLSLQEASIVTRYPLAVCRLQFQRLLDDGILERTTRRYRLTTHWHRAVVRLLKRGNLLSD